MPTNITGFQMMRRKQAEKDKLKKVVSVKAPETNRGEDKAGDVLDVNSMTVEEVREKLTEMGIYFQPNTGEAKLKAKLEGVLNGAE